MSDEIQANSPLTGPSVNPSFARALDELISIAKNGHKVSCVLFNPTDQWLRDNMRVFQGFEEKDRFKLAEEVDEILKEANELNSLGKAAYRAWADAAVKLDTGGIAFFSQFGVARRPDLTHYFVDGFSKNRDAISFSEENQDLFSEIIPYISEAIRDALEDGHTVVQTDRQIGDAPGHSFHARQLLFGKQYLQLPYMWRQLTFDLPDDEREQEPDILEISLPRWLEDLDLPAELRNRINGAGLARLVFKAPTKGLSLHLGFDYMGEHKMGPLSIAMYMAKQSNGLGLQAALSMAHVRTLNNELTNTAIVTTGPSLHGKSTLTIMLEFTPDGLAKLTNAPVDPNEGIYPMNDDIILLQRTNPENTGNNQGDPSSIPYGIYGTENNLYAVPSGLTRDDDPITYDVLRGSDTQPNPQETLENVPVMVSGTQDGLPDFSQNPVRNMRMILSRSRLLKRKSVDQLLSQITGGSLSNAVHIPMEQTDRLFWQGVMRQNTIVPPLIRLSPRQYVRSLMYGEAVQTGAATGAIGQPYVEYFSDPFIIGLEDENANLLFSILEELGRTRISQEFFMFNTGGVGAENNQEASGPTYRKITRDITLTLQEALLRNAVKFEKDTDFGVDVAVAIVDRNGLEVMNLRSEWLPTSIYEKSDYKRRVEEVKRKRYYGNSREDKAGILRYTKVNNEIFEIGDIPEPANEREMAWLLSFYCYLDQAYDTIPQFLDHINETELDKDKIMETINKDMRTSIGTVAEQIKKFLPRNLGISDQATASLKMLGIN